LDEDIDFLLRRVGIWGTQAKVVAVPSGEGEFQRKRNAQRGETRER
jgi:hypothetical protein